MTPERYAAALAGAEPVVYHELLCDSNRSLAVFPCNCGAVEKLRELQGLLVTQFDLDQGLDLDAFTRAFAARFDGSRVEFIADEVYPGHRRLHLVTRVTDRDALFPWLDDYARTHGAVNRRKPGDGFPFNPTA